jgi:cyclopropane fatty-acyl-phospholipid synthase-like methyltransferase
LANLLVVAAAAAFQALAQKFDFSPYKTVGDFGGSAGALSCCVAAAHPHLRCTTLDLSVVHQAAVTYIQQQSLTDQVQVSLLMRPCWQQQ